MHDRLRRARLLAGFDTARAAIERFGWKASTYRAHENGQNKFGASDARAYARAYKVRSSWLLFGELVPFRLQGAFEETHLDAPDARNDAGARCKSAPAGPAWQAYFDLSLEAEDLNDIACCGDILRFAPIGDRRAFSDGDIVAVELRTEAGVDILPRRVFFHQGQAMLAARASAPAEMLANVRILGKAVWLLRRLDHETIAGETVVDAGRHRHLTCPNID